MKELLRLLAYARRYWASLAASVVLMAAAGGATGMMALLIGPIFDRVLNPAAANTPVLLYTDPVFHHHFYLSNFVPSYIHNVWTMVAFAILAVFLIKGVCDYFGNYLVNYVGFSAVTDLRDAVFDKVLKQGAEFFESHSTGRLMSSIMNDIDKVQLATSHILADLLRQSFTAVSLLLVVMTKDWRLALVSLTVLPFVVVPTTRIGRRIRRTSRRTQDRQAELNQILQETLSGHMVVKAFGAEAYESRRFREAAHKLLKTNLRYVAQQALSSPLIEMFGAITIVGLLTYARNQIKAGTLTAGDFTSFVIALLMLYEPVKRLVGIHNIFEQALGASQKVFEYLDHIEEIVEKPGAPKLDKFERGIVFENVSFRYPGAPNGFQIQDLDLEVKAGEVVALVGPSGAGKTTLANLAPRFYDVTGGAVRIDGHDVRDLNLASLRAHIGIVAQDTFLFNDTVANNIAYGRPGAPMEEIRSAAETALAARVHRADAGGLRDRHRRPRPEAQRRPAPADRHRPRAAEERAHPDPRRGHLAPGHRIRDAGAEGAGQPDGAPHGDRDRAPALHHPPRRQDRGAGQGPRERSRHARRADRSGRNLSAAARAAVRGRRIGGGPVSLRSMTGFARVRKPFERGEIVVSLKSVNHRGLDMHFRMPAELDALEREVRGASRTGWRAATCRSRFPSPGRRAPPPR